MARLSNVTHGGNVYRASRDLGQTVRNLIDFSASINPLGPSPSVWRVIRNARQLLAHYPDPDCWELRRALARRWNRDPEEIAVGNGSTELIYALPRALKIRHLLIVQPTFSEYAIAIAQGGGRVSTVYAKRRELYAQPVDELCRVLAKRRTKSASIDGVLLCNPNSPSGQACTVEEIQRLADVARSRGVWLFLDEAFADYCPERSILPLTPSWSRVVVIRSLTKFYALPGLRVGYVVAQPSVIRAVRRYILPWSVNMMGQTAALAALSDTAHAQRSVRFMDRERARMAVMLGALPRCTVIPASANYFFFELPPGWHAREISDQLRAKGLLIRDCSSVPGANVRSIRLAVRSERENDRLICSLSKLLQ